MFAFNVIEEVLLKGSCRCFGQGFDVRIPLAMRELAEALVAEVEKALAPIEPECVRLEEWDSQLCINVSINSMLWSPIICQTGIVFLQGIDVDEIITPDAPDDADSDVSVWEWD